jgi:D-alanyl-D-alanine carboxypeptidase/D-alanyl-D-alanine-endopeptidase (penicillin-binding protein 4)
MRRLVFCLNALLLIAPATLSQTPLPTREEPPQSAAPIIVKTAPAIAPDNSAAATLSSDSALLYGRQGVLVETTDGHVVMEQRADETFNPASAVKLATALEALHVFGPAHRFVTAVWTNGTIDPMSGTLNGDLIISGRDPSFHYEQAMMLAHELNRQGIRVVTGDLIISSRFTMNFDSSARRSGEALYDTLDAELRPVQASRAWNDEHQLLGDAASFPTLPSVSVQGAVYVDAVPKGARMLLLRRSSKLVDILKVLLCFSNNFMAERIGDTLGGTSALRRFLINSIGLNPNEVFLSSTSGLGVNRLTPRAMMKILRALRDELAKNNLSAADILPVAGLDPGTLQKRFTTAPSRGSVIAKTGTLIRTDGGASALVGQLLTANNETLLFVIFNQRGNVQRFRNLQDALVTQLQLARGGPAPFSYHQPSLAMRLASSELDATTQTVARPDEYEP